MRSPCCAQEIAILVQLMAYLSNDRLLTPTQLQAVTAFLDWYEQDMSAMVGGMGRGQAGASRVASFCGHTSPFLPLSGCQASAVPAGAP